MSRLLGAVSLMWSRLQKDQNLKVLLVIMIAGGILRYYGLSNAENTDEYNEIFEALRVASGKFNLERWHKKGFQNILAVEYGFYYVIGYLANKFGNPSDFAAKIVRNMEPLFLMGRYTVASMGTASIGLLYLVGKRIYDGRTALVASAFLAFLPLHVWTSHLVNTDVPLTFFFLLTFYFICRFVDTGKIIDYIMAAFFSAVTINMKTIGFGIIVLFVFGHIMRCRKEGRPIFRYWLSREVYYCFIAFVIGLLVSNPPIVFGIKKLILYHYDVYTNVYGEVPYAIMGSGYLTYLILLYRTLGIALTLLTFFACLYAVYKRSFWDWSLLIFCGIVFLVLGKTSFLVQDRYLMTVLTALFLLAAHFLTRLAAICSKAHQAIFIFVGSLCVFFGPLMNSVGYVRTLTEANTSMVAKRWIEENIPAGSRLLVDAGRTIITSGPRLNQSRAQLEAKLNIIRNLGKGQTYDSPLVRIVDSYSSVYFEMLLRNMPDITYDITSTELGTNVQTVDYYIKHGFQYFVHDEDLQGKIHDPLWRAKYPRSAAFYNSFENRFCLIKSFDPSPTRSGSTIKVFRIAK